MLPETPCDAVFAPSGLLHPAANAIAATHAIVNANALFMLRLLLFDGKKIFADV